jgi:predicted O-methyltransferase YrrM
MRRVARRTVGDCDRGKVIWLEKLSHEVAVSWSDAIDLLFIDGNHAERAVEQDWRDWSPFVRAGGVALLHDACLFEGGWTTPEYGPVKFASRFLRSGEAVGWRIAEEVDSLIVLARTR